MHAAPAIQNLILTEEKVTKKKKKEKKNQTFPNCGTHSWEQDVEHMRLSWGESLLKITHADYVHKMSWNISTETRWRFRLLQLQLKWWRTGSTGSVCSRTSSGASSSLQLQTEPNQSEMGLFYDFLAREGQVQPLGCSVPAKGLLCDSPKSEPTPFRLNI